MPNMDGTGPNGQGPLTGRGMGPCANDTPNQASIGRGRGMGRGRGLGMQRGRGMGRGQGWCYQTRPYTPSKDEYIKDLKDELKAIQDEISDLEKTK